MRRALQRTGPSAETPRDAPPPRRRALQQKYRQRFRAGGPLRSGLRARRVPDVPRDRAGSRRGGPTTLSSSGTSPHSWGCGEALFDLGRSDEERAYGKAICAEGRRGSEGHGDPRGGPAVYQLGTHLTDAGKAREPRTPRRRHPDDCGAGSRQRVLAAQRAMLATYPATPTPPWEIFAPPTHTTPPWPVRGPQDTGAALASTESSSRAVPPARCNAGATPGTAKNPKPRRPVRSGGSERASSSRDSGRGLPRKTSRPRGTASSGRSGIGPITLSATATARSSPPRSRIPGGSSRRAEALSRTTSPAPGAAPGPHRLGARPRAEDPSRVGVVLRGRLGPPRQRELPARPPREGPSRRAADARPEPSARPDDGPHRPALGLPRPALVHHDGVLVLGDGPRLRGGPHPPRLLRRRRDGRRRYVRAPDARRLQRAALGGSRFLPAVRPAAQGAHDRRSRGPPRLRGGGAREEAGRADPRPLPRLRRPGRAPHDPPEPMAAPRTVRPASPLRTELRGRRLRERTARRRRRTTRRDRRKRALGPHAWLRSPSSPCSALPLLGRRDRGRDGPDVETGIVPPTINWASATRSATSTSERRARGARCVSNSFLRGNSTVSR